MQKYCSSCGRPIPDGQGSSCSMCYGDIDHGRDKYCRKWAEKEDDRQYELQQEQEKEEEQGKT